MLNLALLIAATSLILATASAADPPPWRLTDAGRALPEARPALVVVTPGVPHSAYLTWIEALEQEGLDAWTLQLPARARQVEDVTAGVGAAFAALSEGRPTPVIAAHGYGGVFVLLAEVQPAALALVGTPLAAQPVPVLVDTDAPLVAESLPWDPDLLGGLPTEPYAGSLAAAYARWATEFPAYHPPQAPALLIASGIDPVAPPEVVRLPSQGWPDRQWWRAGPLGMEPADPTHAQLLSDPEIARRVARFLAQEAR